MAPKYGARRGTARGAGAKDSDPNYVHAVPLHKWAIKQYLRCYPGEAGEMLLPKDIKATKFFTQKNFLDKLSAEDSELLRRPWMGTNLHAATMQSGVEVLKAMAEATASGTRDPSGFAEVAELFPQDMLGALELLNLRNEVSRDKCSLTDAANELLTWAGGDGVDARMRTLAKVADAAARVLGMAFSGLELCALAANPKAWGKKIVEVAKQHPQIQKFAKGGDLAMLAKGMAAVNMDRMNKQSSQKKRKFGEVSSESKAQESADDGDSDDSGSSDAASKKKKDKKAKKSDVKKKEKGSLTKADDKAGKKDKKKDRDSSSSSSPAPKSQKAKKAQTKQGQKIKDEKKPSAKGGDRKAPTAAVAASLDLNSSDDEAAAFVEVAPADLAFMEWPLHEIQVLDAALQRAAQGVKVPLADLKAMVALIPASVLEVAGLGSLSKLQAMQRPRADKIDAIYTSLRDLVANAMVFYEAQMGGVGASAGSGPHGAACEPPPAGAPLVAGAAAAGAPLGEAKKSAGGTAADADAKQAQKDAATKEHAAP